MGWVVNATPLPLCLLEKDPVPNAYPGPHVFVSYMDLHMDIFRCVSHSTNSDEQYFGAAVAFTSYLTFRHKEVGKTAEKVCGKFR